MNASAHGHGGDFAISAQATADRSLERVLARLDKPVDEHRLVDAIRNRVAAA